MEEDSTVSVDDIDTLLVKIGFGRFHVILGVIYGIVTLTDSAEMLILVLWTRILSCQWNISNFESSMLVNLTLFGLVIGGVIFGKITDNYGRKLISIVENFGIFYFSTLSSLAPNFIIVITLRFISGIFNSGSIVSLNGWISELIPTSWRASVIVLTPLIWSAGSFTVTILFSEISPLIGWRAVIILLTIPTFVGMLCLFWVPESPRFLMLKNNKEKCLKILNDIAKMNKAEYITDVKEIIAVAQPSFRDLFHRTYLSTTIILSYIWFVIGLNFLCLIVILSFMDKIPHQCLQDMSKLSTIQPNDVNMTLDDSCCSLMTRDTYNNLLISTTAEIIFVPVTFFACLFIGRKLLMFIYIAITAIGFLLLNLCLSPLQTNIVSFMIRGSIVVLFSINFIYTSEVFPTSVRCLGLSVCNGASKIGSMVAPFIVYVLIVKFSFFKGTMTVVGLNLLAMLGVFLLPIETKNRKLFQTVYDDIENKSINVQENKNYESIKKN